MGNETSFFKDNVISLDDKKRDLDTVNIIDINSELNKEDLRQLEDQIMNDVQCDAEVGDDCYRMDLVSDGFVFKIWNPRITDLDAKGIREGWLKFKPIAINNIIYLVLGIQELGYFVAPYYYKEDDFKLCDKLDTKKLKLYIALIDSNEMTVEEKREVKLSEKFNKRFQQFIRYQKAASLDFEKELEILDKELDIEDFIMVADSGVTGLATFDGYKLDY